MTVKRNSKTVTTKNIKDTEKYISAKKKEMFMKTVYQNFTVPSVVTTE
jgi:hypothetical protein